MLDKSVDEIVTDGGKLVGVRSGSDVAHCSMVICDPTYAQDRCRKVGQVRLSYVCIVHNILQSVPGILHCDFVLYISVHQVTIVIVNGNY